MNRFLAVCGVIILVMGAWVLLRDPGPIPLLDANRRILADNPATAYCSGYYYSAYNPNREEVAGCEERSNYSHEREIGSVVGTFCRGLYDKYSFPIADCINVVNARQFWPTNDAQITNQWNRRFPWPGDTLKQAKEDVKARTGDREGSTRSSTPTGVPYQP